MKAKSALALIPLTLLSACGSSLSYSELVDKLSVTTASTIMNNSYDNGIYWEEGFFQYNSSAVIYCSSEGTSSGAVFEVNVYVVLPQSSNVPSYFDSIYSSEYKTTSGTTTETAAFTISNYFNSNSTVFFNRYVGGDTELKQTSQNLAKSMTNLLLTVFSWWADDELGNSLNSIGLFPNYSY